METAIASRADGLAALAASLRAQGYAFVPSTRMREALGDSGACSDWDRFASAWDRLPLDTFMADHGRYRRRRRASGGPAEKTFAALVGLELRPRRLRDAANLFSALEASGGPEARDAAWAHPDVAPDAADLDDPLGYVERQRTGGEADDWDAGLDALLRGDTDGPAPDGPSTS